MIHSELRTFEEELHTAALNINDSHLFRTLITKAFALGLYRDEWELGAKLQLSASKIENFEQGVAFPRIRTRRRIYNELKDSVTAILQTVPSFQDTEMANMLFEILRENFSSEKVQRMLEAKIETKFREKKSDVTATAN